MNRTSTIALILVLAVLGLFACNHDGGGHDSGLPTVDSQAHFGMTECVDYAGARDPIFLNKRLGQLAAHKCDLQLCFGQSASEPECMYGCPPARLAPSCGAR